MEREFEFPNPVQRTDRPIPSKRWRYALGAALAVAALIMAFLPQIFSTSLGRRLLKMRLESQYRGQAWITDLKTSWFGPTHIHKFSLTDAEGRQIKFTDLKSSMSFWRVLTGSLDLGEAQITDLYAEFVVNYGDGTDSLDRLMNGDAVSSRAGIVPTRLPARSLVVPDLSGHLTLTNATLVLTRGQIADRQFRTVFRSARLSHINGTLDIRALDRPWTASLSGRIGSGEEMGLFTLTAKADLGENSRMDLRRATANVTLTMQNAPNTARGAGNSFAWVMLPLFSMDDYTAMFGPVWRKLDLDLRLAGGRITFDRLEAAGQLPDGGQTHLAGRPMMDVIGPPTLGAAAPIVASVQLTPELARAIVRVNPFLQDAASGRVSLLLDELVLPLTGTDRPISARGQLGLSHVVLLSGQVSSADAFPRELITQWQAVVGNTAPSVTLEAPSTRFVVKNGTTRIDEPMQMKLDGLPVALLGSVSPSGQLQMQAKMTLPARMQEDGQTDSVLAVSIDGTVQQPRMHLPSHQAKSGPQAQRRTQAIDQHMAALRQRSSDHLLQLSAQEVQKLIQAVERINARNTTRTAPTPGESGHP